MDWLTFIAALVESLAWPTTLLLVVWVFKDPVLRLVPSIDELSLPGGISAKFGAKLGTVERESSSSSDAGEPQYSIASPETAVDDPVATAANPTGVVMEQWKELEQVARFRLLSQSRQPFQLNDLFVPIEDVFSRLLREGLIDPHEYNLLEELRALRDMAARSRKPLRKDLAERYAALAEALARGLARTPIEVGPAQ